MANDTGKAAGTEVKWLAGAVAAWQACVRTEGGAPSQDELAGRLGAQMGVDKSIAQAWLQACDSLAGYAQAPLDELHDAIDEEGAGQEAARRATLPVMQARMQARVDARDRLVAGHAVCPDCLEVGQSRGLVKRGWLSTLGPVTLTRRWSRCEPCGKGFAESQVWLHLPDGRYTAKLAEAISLVATTVPHGMAADLIGKLLAVEVSEHGVQDIVEQRAAPLASLLDAEAHAFNPYKPDGSERQCPRPHGTVPVADTPEVAYLEADGVFPMTRKENKALAEPVEPGARGGKGRHYDLEGKEVKNAVLYGAKACAQESDSRGSILDKRYVSYLGNCKMFALLLWVQMRRMRFDEAKLLVVLSDGAEWIRELAKWLPAPLHVLLILDLFHAKHRIWEVANALYGDKTPEARAWADEQCLRVEAGEVTAVIQSLRFLKPSRKAAAEMVDALATYFDNNKDRMDYPAYRARGLRVSTAAIESANYHVTGARLKQQGMRWNEQGASEMSRLRADLFNGNWQARTRQLMAA